MNTTYHNIAKKVTGFAKTVQTKKDGMLALRAMIMLFVKTKTRRLCLRIQMQMILHQIQRD